jgi:hypothetical protein
LYLIAGFIAAHKAAQVQVFKYVGEDTSADTPEEKKIEEESNNNIARAMQVCRTFAAVSYIHC